VRLIFFSLSRAASAGSISASRISIFRLR
jgi:hypothetical protein